MQTCKERYCISDVDYDSSSSSGNYSCSSFSEGSLYLNFFEMKYYSVCFNVNSKHEAVDATVNFFKCRTISSSF